MLFFHATIVRTSSTLSTNFGASTPPAVSCDMFWSDGFLMIFLCHQHRRHHWIVGAYRHYYGYYDMLPWCMNEDSSVSIISSVAAGSKVLLSLPQLCEQADLASNLCFHHISLLPSVKYSAEFLCKSTECSCVETKAMTAIDFASKQTNAGVRRQKGFCIVSIQSSITKQPTTISSSCQSPPHVNQTYSNPWHAVEPPLHLP